MTVFLDPDTGYFVAFADIAQGWYGLAALRYRLEAAGVEAAAGRRVEGAGDLSLQYDTLPLLLDKGVGDGGHHQPQRLGAFGHQAAGDGAGGVAHLLGDVLNASLGLLADQRAIVQGAGDGGVGNLGNLGNVFDVCRNSDRQSANLGV